MPRESAVQRRIIKALRDRGIWAGKMVIEGRRGYPDVLAMQDGKAWLLEVKADEAARRANTPTSAIQEVRHDELRSFGIPVAVVISPEEALEFVEHNR